MALPQNKNSRNLITERQNALDHLAQGYSVIPVKRAHNKKERIPLVKWGIYQSLRPTAGEVRAWWTFWPDANPAIVTGALSGIIALDVDGPDGLAWLEALGLPPTRTVSRGAAGRCHLWFRHPGFRVSNRTLHPQVEVKGDGGLIPCPGAVHWSGAPYQVVDNRDIAPCPAFLVNLLKSAEKPAPPRYQPSPDDDALIGLAVDALSPARSENRDDWLAVLMALHSAGEQYHALAHTFSARCPEKYQPRGVDQTWKSFKRGGITIATLFKMADEDSPGWRPALPRSAPHPSRRTAAAPVDAALPDWPGTLPDADRRLAFTYWDNQGKAVNAVLQAILLHIGSMIWFDLAELQARSGIAQRTLYHVFTDYGLAQILDAENGSGLHFATLTGDSPAQNQQTDSGVDSIGQSGKMQPGAKKPGKRYRLPARAIFWERVIERRIRPIEEQRDQPAKITAALARSLDAATTPAQLDAANAPIEAALSDAEKQAEALKARRLEAKLRAIRHELADVTATPLPEVVDGKAWHKDYVGAVVERYESARIGVQESRAQTAEALGLSPSTVYRTEKRLGFFREPVHDLPVTITDPAKLPEPVYAFDHRGFPVRAVLLRAGAVLTELDYHVEAHRQEAAAALATPGTEAVIYYQQAGIIRRMSEAERAAEKAEAEAAAAAARAMRPPAPLRPPVKPSTSPPYYTGLDYEYGKARRLVIERLVRYHGFNDLNGTVRLRGEVYADRPLAALGGPDLMKLTRFERLSAQAPPGYNTGGQ